MVAVYLPASLFESDAWAGLSSGASRLLLDMASWLNGGNNGFLRYSVRDAATLLHCDRHEAEAAFSELERAGFIVKTGVAHGRGRGTARTWAISLHPGLPPIPAARWHQQQEA